MACCCVCLQDVEKSVKFQNEIETLYKSQGRRLVLARPLRQQTFRARTSRRPYKKIMKKIIFANLFILRSHISFSLIWFFFFLPVFGIYSPVFFLLYSISRASFSNTDFVQISSIVCVCFIIELFSRCYFHVNHFIALICKWPLNSENFATNLSLRLQWLYGVGIPFVFACQQVQAQLKAFLQCAPLFSQPGAEVESSGINHGKE